MLNYNGEFIVRIYHTIPKLGKYGIAKCSIIHDSRFQFILHESTLEKMLNTICKDYVEYNITPDDIIIQSMITTLITNNERK